MRKKGNPFKGSPESLYEMMIQNINKLSVCRLICKRVHSDFLEQSRITLFLEVERQDNLVMKTNPRRYKELIIKNY